MSFFSSIWQIIKNLIQGKPVLDEKLLGQLADNLDDETTLGRVLSHLGALLKSRKLMELVQEFRGQDEPVEGTRQIWNNQIANQTVMPLQYRKPKTLTDLHDILKEAHDLDMVVKAAGSGHSYSDVATTRDFFIDTHDLKRVQSAGNPLAGQLREEDKKPDWRSANLRANWTPTPTGGYNEITVDSTEAEIMEVRNAFSGNIDLYECECGIRLRHLVKECRKDGLGLTNMGGYAGQTIMGVISTSTHGSGIELPPFPDGVKSLILATTGEWNGSGLVTPNVPNAPVRYYRIEPSNGITDPTSYQNNIAHYTHNGIPIQLIQDDDCFYSVICNMGTMGVVYSVVLQLMQDYWLTETKIVSDLKAVYDQLQPNPNNPGHVPDVLIKYRNVGVLLTPYPMDGNKVKEIPTEELKNNTEKYYKDFPAQHYLRNVTPPGIDDAPDEEPPSPITEVLGKLRIVFEVLVAVLNLVPKLAPFIVKMGIGGKTKDYARPYEKIYLSGANGQAGFATEIGFPIEDENGNYTFEHVKKAIDRVILIAQQSRLDGDQYHTAPYVLRFVKKSDAYMSMMNGVNTCMIELDQITGSYAGIEVNNRQQNALYDLGGRPHWGLEFDQLSGNQDLMSRIYDKFPKWKKVYDQMNSKGTFNNDTTNRLGFSTPDYKRGPAPAPSDPPVA